MNQGLPTDLVFIDRRIVPGHVQVYNEYDAKTLCDFITHDLASVKSGMGSIIRPFIGKFGSGKTTQIKCVQRIAHQTLPQCIIVRLNLRDTPLQRKEFLGAVQRQVIESLKPYVNQLIPDEPLATIAEDFGSVEIVRQIRRLTRGSEEDRLEAHQFFYDEIAEERIFQLLKGTISVNTRRGYPVVLLIDELEYLATYDDNQALTAMIAERMMRQLLENCPENLYIAFTCEHETFEKLQKLNEPFYRIAKPQEVVLDAISEDEKRTFIENLLEASIEHTFGRINVDDVLRKIHGTLAAFFMNQFVGIVARTILEHINVHKELFSKIHETYERNARIQAAQILAGNRFESGHLANDVTRVGGYDFDIFAERSDRTLKIRAFGEIKSVQCSKAWAEEFVDWLRNLRGTEYNPSRDCALFIAPDFTPEAKLVLEDANIQCHSYADPMVQSMIEAEWDRETVGLTSEEAACIEWIRETKGKARTFRVVEREYGRPIIESLVGKNKVQIKASGNTKNVHLLASGG